MTPNAKAHGPPASVSRSRVPISHPNGLIIGDGSNDVPLNAERSGTAVFRTQTTWWPVLWHSIPVPQGSSRAVGNSSASAAECTVCSYHRGTTGARGIPGMRQGACSGRR